MKRVQAKPTTAQVARRIHAYLRLFERERWMPLDRARAWDGGGGYIRVAYNAPDGSCALTMKQALRYLDALDAGAVGRHDEVLG